MDSNRLRELIGFYENELSNNILPFWLSGCEDKENGGYFNCFTNDGSKLVSKDKYTWSQGRFVWLFSRLSMMERTFKKEERRHFLNLAKNGRDFLVKHCFMNTEPVKCVFLMNAKGEPKYVDGYDSLDMSIYADGFVLAGLTEYALAAGDRSSYEIAKPLFESIMKRYETFEYKTLPYPISPRYIMHGFYMSRILHCYDITSAARVFDIEYSKITEKRLKDSINLLFTLFVDEDYNLREVVYRGGGRVPGIFGNHCNPGHICEDMWFIQHSEDLIGDNEYTGKCAKILRNILKKGWDDKYGGLYHFCSVEGGEPVPGANDPVTEPIYQQLMSGWGDKLWWVHSEALYSTLLFGNITGDSELLSWYEKIFDYTFSTFPNKDREIREWIQIRLRDGKPNEKCVALPVKDPFHIARDLLLILRYMYSLENR